MKNARFQIIVWFFLTISTVVIYKIITKDLDKPAPEIIQARIGLEIEQIDLERARITQLEHDKLNLQRSHLKRNADLWFYGATGFLSSLSLSLIIVAAGIHRERVKRTSVHIYRIGQHNEVVVHERDLSIAAPIAMGLMNAEQLKQINGGVDKALQLYSQMADIQTRQIRALVRRKGIDLADSSDLPQPALPAASTPTFAALLLTGHIAPGQPMVIGYTAGLPMTATWKDLFSSAIGGQSGTGKTNTLRSLIAQSILQDVFFWLCDPHQQHEESLIASLAPLTETPLIQIATNKEQVETILKEVNATIDRRLNSSEPSQQLKVLGIDELSFLMNTTLRKPVEDTIKRIGKEGRKVKVYGLFSSQSWLAEEIGTSARDNLTSIIVHHMKRNQAQALLQDSDYTKQAKKLHTGQILFCPVNKPAQVLDVPFCTANDMATVARTIGRHKEAMAISSHGANNAAKQRASDTPAETLIPPANQSASDPRKLTPAMLNEQLQAGWKQREIERQTGVNQSKISNFKNGNERALTEEEQHVIFDVIFPKDEKNGTPDDENQRAVANFARRDRQTDGNTFRTQKRLSSIRNRCRRIRRSLSIGHGKHYE